MRSALICGVLLATVASAAEAEKEPEPPPEVESRRTFVGLVPIALSESLIAIDGERVLTPKLSAWMGLRFAGSFSRRGSGDVLGDSTQLVAGVEPGVRYYLTGSALDGLWLGPHLELSYQRSTNTSQGLQGDPVTNHNRDWTAGGAVLLGYSMIVTRGLTVQAGVGLGCNYSSSTLQVGSLLDSDSGGLSGSFDNHGWTLSQRATLAVGWSF